MHIYIDRAAAILAGRKLLFPPAQIAILAGRKLLFPPAQIAILAGRKLLFPPGANYFRRSAIYFPQINGIKYKLFAPNKWNYM